MVLPGQFKSHFIFQMHLRNEFYILVIYNKQLIQFLEGSWNHEYFGSLAKLT